MFQIPRWLLLATLFVASFLWLLLLRSQTPAAEQGIANIPLVWAMLAGFLPYLLACALVLFTRAPVGRLSSTQFHRHLMMGMYGGRI